MKRLAAFMLLLAEIGGAYAGNGDAERLRAWHAGEKVAEEAVAEYGIDRCFASSEIDDALFARMYGKSYKADCTVPRSELRYLRVLHRNLAGETLLGELVCDPVTYHGRFVPEYFESEKTNLLEAIRSLINDKRDWADSRLLRALCDGEAYAVPRLGDEETVDKLQALKVYTQYRDLISTAPLEIIYSGSADLERVKQALAAAFATLPREEVRVISTAAPHVCRESVQHVEDVLDVTQGKLGMGFSCGSDDMPALLMGNTLFGGSSNSKLFLNVREKLSLCYYASSLYHRQKGLITVSSGIEFQNYQRAYDEIMAQLEAVQKGELEDWELEGARSTLLNSYATVGDSQGKLENFYLGQAATGQHETPADLARAIQDMTAERICRAMSTVKLDTVYFLKGKEAEA